MQGKVKWFSVEKGYGFIVGDDGTDHHFVVRDVKGADLPRNGDIVTFEPRSGKKGPRAVSVSLVSRGTNESQRHNDDRVVCTHCGKKMVPRIITNQGSLSKSVCPFCGGMHKNFGMCFIATAVYGDENAPEVVALRRFRDSTLRPKLLGRVFIRTYYRFSPAIASYLSGRHQLSSLIRSLLNVFLQKIGKRFKRDVRNLKRNVGPGS